MTDAGPIGVTEVIDTRLADLRLRTKKHLTKAEADNAYGDLVSTISLVNSAWAAETGFGPEFGSSPVVTDVQDATRGEARDEPRVMRFIGSGSGAGGGSVTGPVSPARNRPPILAKLTSWVAQIKDILHDIAKAMNATSYTVTVGFPWGISIAVNFNI